MKVCEEMDDLVFEVMILNHYNLYFVTLFVHGPTELMSIKLWLIVVLTIHICILLFNVPVTSHVW